MPAAGKVNAANIRPNQHVKVRTYGERGVDASYTKVKGAHTATVRSVAPVKYGRKTGRKIVFQLDGEDFTRVLECGASQTFWLA